jgi:hypothetical protein
MAFPGLRYSKAALLVFGAGLVLGLAVVSAELYGLARIASVAMAGGIAALPIALIADWRRRASAGAPPAKRRRKPTARKRKASPSRSRGHRKR